jgi:flagellar biosynthetic protein FliR
MTQPAAELAMLHALPGWAFAAVLVLVRIGCACMLLPGVGEIELPTTVRAGFVLAFTALVLPALLPDMPAMPEDVPRLLVLLLAEITAGLWLGWLARLIVLAPAMAGQLIAGAIGMTNVIQPDPALGPSTAALSRLLGLAAPVILLATGLHAYPLAAVIGSYQLVQPGHFLPAGDTTQSVVTAVAQAFGLGVRLAAPFLVTAVLFHGAMGLISRLVPNLQTHFATIPGQIIGGLLLFGVLSAALIAAWTDAARDGLAAMPGL